MTLTIFVDSKEAIPVRAIPFVTGWMVSPDVIAKALANTDHWVKRLEAVVAYHIVANGEYAPMLPKEWDGVEADLHILSEKLKASETFEQENYSQWRQKSIFILPARCFVWKDEFVTAFSRSYSPKKLSLIDERPGDRELNFTPRVPVELIDIVMDGFSKELIDTDINKLDLGGDNLKISGRRTQQLEVILAVIAALEFDPLKIPDGGKVKIKAHCLTSNKTFTDSSFDHAWKAGVAADLFRMANHEKYSST